MKQLLSLTAIGVMVTLFALPFGYARAQGQAPAQAEKTFEGQLVKVDANAKLISVKGATEEMQFRFTDQTQVLGPENNVQGLANSTGTLLKVTYRDAAPEKLATRIEVIAKR